MVAANRPASWVSWPLLIVVGGGIVGLAIGLIGAQRNDTHTPAWVPLVAAALGCLVGLALVIPWLESRAFHLRRQIPLAAEDVYDHAERWFGRASWVLARGDGRELVFWRRTEPVLGVFLVLMLLGAIPGILYYIAARGTQTVHIAVRPLPAGADLEVMVQPRLGDGRNRVVDFFNSLHQLR